MFGESYPLQLEFIDERVQRVVRKGASEVVVPSFPNLRETQFQSLVL